jgi:mitochondrial chaperone BCS1
MPEVNVTLLWTGIFLGLIGLCTALFRNAPKHFFTYLQRFLIVRVDIMNGDSLFEWVKLWFDKDAYTKRARLVSASAIPITEWNTATIAPKKWKILFTPAPGVHLLSYRSRPVIVHRDRKDITAGGSVVGVRDTFTMYFFTRNQNIVRDFFEDAHRVAEEEKANKLTIFSGDLYQNWNVLAHRNVRPLESVILDEGVKEATYDDINNFLSSEAWYKSMAIPFHRGYLFYGPPGSGKSSLAIALASEFRLDTYLLNLNNLSDGRLMSLLSTMPSHSILLLEDIDSIFVKREALAQVTFSGLLNALDGIHSKDGLIVFMSTNHIERLDPALLRPGRIDCKVYLGMASPYQIKEMFLRFFPETTNEAKRFAAQFAGRSISMATLQEYLLARRYSIERALDEVNTIEAEVRQSSTPGIPAIPITTTTSSTGSVIS